MRGPLALRALCAPAAAGWRRCAVRSHALAFRAARAFASTVDEGEMQRFAKLAQEWWDVRGEFRALHEMVRSTLLLRGQARACLCSPAPESLVAAAERAGRRAPRNPVRVDYMRRAVLREIQPTSSPITPFAGLRMLDMGCGGGLLSEALARLGADVVGIDALRLNIDVAKAHAAQQQGLAGSVAYEHSTAEALAARGEQFDVVASLEVLEHVSDPNMFLQALCSMVKPGGLLFLSTINKTAKSFLLAIVAAEYIARLVPRGTHDWNKFIAPKTVENMLRAQGVQVCNATGLLYNPLMGRWTESSSDTDVNYILYGRKAATP